MVIDNVDSQFIEINIPEFDTSDETATSDPVRKTAINARNSIRNHFKRVIKEKYKERKQYNKKLPFILVIYLEDWRFNFESDATDFQSIKQNLEETIRPYRYLSRIILYSPYLYNGRYIQNYYSTHRVIERELVAAGILNQRYFQSAFTRPDLDLKKNMRNSRLWKKFFMSITPRRKFTYFKISNH